MAKENPYKNKSTTFKEGMIQPPRYPTNTSMHRTNTYNTDKGFMNKNTFGEDISE